MNFTEVPVFVPKKATTSVRAEVLLVEGGAHFALIFLVYGLLSDKFVVTMSKLAFV